MQTNNRVYKQKQNNHNQKKSDPESNQWAKSWDEKKQSTWMWAVDRGTFQTNNAIWFHRQQQQLYN